MTEPVIEAANVSKSFGSGPAWVQALKNVNLTLNGGELTVLMGPSGSGKTTLLSILGCMLAPSGGTVRVCGTSTSGARPEELAKIRRQGWAQDKGEYTPSIQAFAAPISDRAGKVVAALSVPFLAGAVPEHMEAVRLAAISSASAISGDLSPQRHPRSARPAEG